MTRKKRELPLIEGLEITAYAAEGKALGRYDGQVVFVPMAVAGDVADVQIRSRHRRFMEGSIVRMIKPSPLRREPFCRHFGVCGGCKWQNLPYDEQLRLKRRQVLDQLTRIGKIELPPVCDTLGSQQTEWYRNKLEFTFSPKRWLTYEEIASGGEIEAGPALGFHVPGMFDKVMDVECCHLQSPLSNDIRNEIRSFCILHGFEFYDIRNHTGLMRGVVIRTSSTGQVMVIVIFARRHEQHIRALMEHLQRTFPQITSLMYVVNEKLNDSLSDQTPELFAGCGHIMERMGELQFKVGPKSFYQTNSAQAERLYGVVRDMAGLNPGDTVYDLYTGTGTIANFVARLCRRVVGIEYVPEAIEDARHNSQLNGIGNTVFYAGDMKNVLDDAFVQANGRPDVVILDPPRAGADQPVIEVIMRAAPQRIVYVSCNPATQARDAALLDSMYRVTAVQPVDMFPHTHHVENVIKFEKR